MKNNPQPDDFDIISAIWILACNDENPLITYKGLIHRLGLSATCDVQAIVRSRPELFRPGAQQRRVDEWKFSLRAGKNLPSWIKEIGDPEKRRSAIEEIGANDIFRSQFRAHSNAERSPIEIVKWGLEHLDRLRKAKGEAMDASAKKWQMWLVFWVTLVGVLSQFTIAFAKYKGWI